jgi:hypothetical protein
LIYVVEKGFRSSFAAVEGEAFLRVRLGCVLRDLADTDDRDLKGLIVLANLATGLFAIDNDATVFRLNQEKKMSAK